MRIFSSIAYVQVPRELRKKLDERVEKTAIVGIRNTGYLVWSKGWNRIIYTRDVVKFVETKMYMENVEQNNMNKIGASVFLN